LNIDELIQALLESVASERLALLAGAGVSLGVPSSVPSAASVAHNAFHRHEELTGERLPSELDWDLEKIASHFYHVGRLSYFVNTLVDWGPFRGNPNRAHFAVADFLACRAFDVAITTNFDTLVEVAAERIGERDFRAAIDGGEANRSAPYHPYLKVYGCGLVDRDSTLWCVEQTSSEPLSGRLARSKSFLSGRLLNRDLLVIGFWSDWSYLNSILEAALPPESGAHVYLVDPQSATNLKDKAPQLWAWAEKHGRFVHIEAKAEEVLERLRSEFSRLLLRRIMKRAGPSTDVAWLDHLDADDRFFIRRDLAGVDGVARDRTYHPGMSAFARAHEALNAGGAVFHSGRYSLGERRIRIIHVAGERLSEVRAALAASPALTRDLDVVICAGADDDANASSNIVRSEAVATIIRGGTEAIEFLTSAASLLQTEAP
jgi:hypothetical protein